jgi:hypothetical protein
LTNHKRLKQRSDDYAERSVGLDSCLRHSVVAINDHDSEG